MAESGARRPTLALIVDDHEWSSRSLETILAPGGYAFLRAYNARQALELAKETTPDFVIVDADLPDLPGVDVCRSLQRELRISACTPILMTTTGRMSQEDRLAALKAGAWDVLSWPIDGEEVLLKLDLYLKGKFEADRTREESLVDHVTGLYNLRGLMRRARELGSDAFRSSRALACVAFAPQSPPDAEAGNGEDYGALWSTVERMGRVFGRTGRVSDAIGRVRLGEFVIIAPATDDAGALQLARRLLRAVDSAAQEEGVARPRLLVGYNAVSDFQASGIQPAALLAGATTALRRLQAEPGDATILHYEGEGEAPAS
jgi:PleD family two-component response regulator